MTKNKNNQTVWKSRITKKNSSLFSKVGSSINIDKKLFKEDIEASIVHVEMLHKQKIINFKVKNKIVYGLKKIRNQILKKKYQFKEEDEDIHMSIEKSLFNIIGDDAGYMHTARSRNDQVVTDLKLWIKKSTIEIINMLNLSIKIILNKAEKNIYVVMPGFTHLKNAQPISFAHYLMAYIEMFARDRKRFSQNLNSLNENPLGVAALSGTSFKIDRNYTTKKLGFISPTRNSIDTVADRDFVLDFLYTSSVCSMHISRIAEEFIIWNSDAFNLISLKDNVLTGSSIMPQKKNPDTLEYLRGQTGNIYGNLFSMKTILKGLPISYFKDLQDDKKLVFDTYDKIKNCILVLNEVFNNLRINRNEMEKLSQVGYITSTDFADYLVKYLNYPFRKAYDLSAKLVNYCEKNKKNLKDLTFDEINKIDKKLDINVMKIFDLKYSVNSKKSYGGTSFENIKKMIKKIKKEIK